MSLVINSSMTIYTVCPLLAVLGLTPRDSNSVHHRKSLCEDKSSMSTTVQCCDTVGLATGRLGHLDCKKLLCPVKLINKIKMNGAVKC